MPAETPNAPAAAPEASGQSQQATQQTAETVPAAPTPPDSAPSAAGERQLAEAEQRASEQAERAEQLQQALDAVQQVLNPGGDSAQQDPTQLAAQVAERDKQLADLSSRLRTAQVELAAHRAAGEQGARADRLLNSRSFLDSVANLDPDSAKFGEQLAEAIRAAVESDPDLYRATPSGPPRGGAELGGPPAADKRPKTLHDAVAARLTA